LVVKIIKYLSRVLKGKYKKAVDKCLLEEIAVKLLVCRKWYNKEKISFVFAEMF